MTDLTLYLLLGVFGIAFLYSCVGHAGASGYIAVMTLLGLAPAEIKPAALALNILVASIGTFQFFRAGYFSWPLFWPFALLSFPFAYLGGYVSLPALYFKALVGFVLFASAFRFLFEPPPEVEPTPPSKAVALSAGAGLGLLSGLTGTGGGIFLTPLAIFMGWGRTKTVAAVSASFILVNSISGLAGHLRAGKGFPDFVVPLAVAAALGGTAGSYLGSQRLSPLFIKRLLAAVLAIAGWKLMLTS